MKIGQVAAEAGVGIDTVRYYERIGLLPAAPRRTSGYRVFSASTVGEIRRIKVLQDLGMSLDEIRATVAPAPSCARGSAHLRSALARTEAQLETLVAVRGRLRAALAKCAQGTCALVDR